MRQPLPPSSGNALFIILIAVALFAALSYAVTTSGRGRGSPDKEQAILHAAQITQQGAAVQATVQRMLLTGTSVADLEFCSASAAGCGHLHTNDACSSGIDCVFAPDGGGAAVPETPEAAVGTLPGASYDRWTYISDWAWSGFGSDAAEVTAFACAVTQEVCEAINTGLGYSPTPVAFNPLAYGIACGVPSAATGSFDVAMLCPGCAGKHALCVTTGVSYIYYHHLAQR